jgi:hypothetical protein
VALSLETDLISNYSWLSAANIQWLASPQFQRNGAKSCSNAQQPSNEQSSTGEIAGRERKKPIRGPFITTRKAKYFNANLTTKSYTSCDRTAS